LDVGRSMLDVHSFLSRLYWILAARGGCAIKANMTEFHAVTAIALRVSSRMASITCRLMSMKAASVITS